MVRHRQADHCTGRRVLGNQYVRLCGLDVEGAVKINSTTKMTYRDWRKHGYQVRKGEKSSARLAGEALFSFQQVDHLASTRRWMRQPRVTFYDGRLRGEQAHNSMEGYEYEGSWEETLGGFHAFHD